QGVFAKFNNGWFETEDQEIISLLKSAKTYGIDFWSVDEPSQPNPQGLAEEKIKEQTKEEVVTDCPKCGKTFKNKAGVLAHIRFYHKDETP
ncbi:MAG: C2H2-type zinc finger protein, partial [Patescibacteria group bacterium]|nr:C2H2-type zinc finger protein [Patescibacteria group bacterium]